MSAGAPREIVYLSLGSNMGDRAAHLQKAMAGLEELPGTTVLRQSGLYGSKAWGKTDQPDFLNMVIEVGTVLDPLTLLDECKRIERDEGRIEGERWGPRPLDIDILLYSQFDVHTPDLVIPHERIWQRAFVLLPLADLRPDLAGPDGRPIGDWLQDEAITSQGVWPVQAGEQASEG